MAYVITNTVYVEMASVPLATAAWEVLNGGALELAKPAKRRGQDRIIAGASGVRVKPRRATITRRELMVLVMGHRKWDGTAHPAGDTGLQLNLSHLTAALLPGSGLPISATVHKPGGGTVTGDIQVEDFDWEYLNDAEALATIDISIPGGALS